MIEFVRTDYKFCNDPNNQIKEKGIKIDEQVI